MTIIGFIAVGTGAACGAWIRWGLGLFLNPVFPMLPLGTLVANLVGGFFMGMMIILLLKHVSLSPEIMLMITTGFLGSLTTFSALSAETIMHVSRQEYFWSGVIILSHVAGSLAMTGLGMWSAKLVWP